MAYKGLFYLIDLTLCNSWLLYLKDHNQTHTGEKGLNLYEFKRIVSECWIKQSVAEEDRMLRPGRPASQVPRGLRFDGKDHWPHGFSGWKDRTRCVHCNHQTYIYWLKFEFFYATMV